MEYKEVKEIISKLKEDITNLEWELEKELSEAGRLRRQFNLLASASNVQICQNCDGVGGVYFDMGEQGGETWMCDACSCTGIVDRLL